jgi:phosphoglycerol transferase MdoB-like AlkP superfamily enzyme
VGLFALQILFYVASWLGWQAELRGKKIKLLFVPLYFTMMNVAVFAGFLRFVRKSQPAAWEKADRTVVSSPLMQ